MWVSEKRNIRFRSLNQGYGMFIVREPDLQMNITRSNFAILFLGEI